VQRKWLILTAVSLGALMSTLDGSIVNIALPAMQQDFGVDITTVQWVTVAYLLMIGSLLLPMGRLGEVLTFKRVYLAGFGLFTAASVLCALAPGVGMLIAFRVLQAVGAAAITAIGPADIVRTFPGPERGRAPGPNGVAPSWGVTLGPNRRGLRNDAGRAVDDQGGAVAHAPIVTERRGFNPGAIPSSVAPSAGGGEPAAKPRIPPGRPAVPG